ncbi:hypothetical protein HALLA_05375 [Halostagnicola larsenii XH-48]|uniref:Uncharacterized protein n=1 Tax=Halostagnicola larsenii XH-48 TaxID=797299 RepID=W0JQ24_9EURY|nr:hypothetical protein [Halostagnicola larsenii]AHG00709.1 hypothetical protein HALLA_05375 [Halostagnicola larsenii XH-48]
MVMRIRIGSGDDDDDDERGWSETDTENARREDGGGEDGEGDDRSWIRAIVIPPDLGGLFARLAFVFLLLTILSMFALVAVLLIESDEPFVDQPHLEDPISGWIWLLSLTGTAVSTIGYTAWSFWKQRRLRERYLQNQPSGYRETPFYERPIRALQLASDDSNELDEYEKRIQKTVTALVLCVFVGAIPGQIVLDALLGL